MPAGPGKFEGEGFATFALYRLSLDSAQDDEVGTVDDIGWHGLFRGPVEVELEDPIVAEGAEYGYTAEEISDGATALSRMRGAILGETSQGFVWAVLYSKDDTTNGRDGLETDWAELQAIDSEVER